MHIQFPVYRRGNTLVLHVRIAGLQVKRSLRTLDPNLAKVRATQMLGALMAGELANTQPAAHAWSMSGPQSSDAANQQNSLTPEQALAIACSAPVATSVMEFSQSSTATTHLSRSAFQSSSRTTTLGSFMEINLQWMLLLILSHGERKMAHLNLQLLLALM